MINSHHTSTQRQQWRNEGALPRRATAHTFQLATICGRYENLQLIHIVPDPNREREKGKACKKMWKSFSFSTTAQCCCDDEMPLRVYDHNHILSHIFILLLLLLYSNFFFLIFEMLKKSTAFPLKKSFRFFFSLSLARIFPSLFFSKMWNCCCWRVRVCAELEKLLLWPDFPSRW